jgi:hypothetical protein
MFVTVPAVRTVVDLDEALAPFKDSEGWVFRGQADVFWELKPSIARGDFDPTRESEISALANNVLRRNKERKNFTEWKILAIAQHWGIPTRLLDWTGDPDVATFFALAETAGTDAAIYALKSTRTVDESENDGPFAFKGVSRFCPNVAVEERIDAQKGSFTAHGPPELSLEDGVEGDDELQVVIITAESRVTIFEEIQKRGKGYDTVFPDIVGLARHIRGAFRLPEGPPLQGIDQVIVDYERQLARLKRIAGRARALGQKLKPVLTRPDDELHFDRMYGRFRKLEWQIRDISGKLDGLKSNRPRPPE